MHDIQRGNIEELAASDTEAQSLFPHEDAPLGGTFDAAVTLRAVRWYASKLERLAAEKAELLARYSQWYDARASQYQARIDAYKRSMEAYLHDRGEKKLATPEGTAFFRTSRRTNWTDLDALLAWAKEQLPSAVKTKLELDKVAVKSHVRATGEVPPGYEEVAETTLAIRFATDNGSQEQ